MFDQHQSSLPLTGSVWGGAAIGTIFGWISHYGLAVPTWTGLLFTVPITITTGALAVIVNAYVKRWIGRRIARGERHRKRGTNP